MKVSLMFSDRPFSLTEPKGPLQQYTAEDLDLESILGAMSGGDELIYSVCRCCLLSPLGSREEILYRQGALSDFIQNPGLLKSLCSLCSQTLNRRRSSWYRLSSSRISTVYSSAAELIGIYLPALQSLRELAEEYADKTRSKAMEQFFSTLRRELSEEYLQQVRSLRSELSISGGLLIGARFGPCLQGVSYTLLSRQGLSKLRWLLAPAYVLAERDDSGAADLGLRRERALRGAAGALSGAAEQLGQFIEKLQEELAFYMGCLNLYDKLKPSGAELCMPCPESMDCRRRSWSGLRELSLCLKAESLPVGNELSDTEAMLYIISGANQGGKTTFLRSLGQAQLMMQCGCFVCAGSFSSPVRKNLYTHFKKEEDKSLRAGKLSEELCRMREIADALSGGELLLFNESLSSTNQREGSEILSGICRALTEKGIEIFSVTHLSDYASGFKDMEQCCFLRAGRLPDGSRSFKISPGLPLSSAFAEDIFKKIFG